MLKYVFIVFCFLLVIFKSKLSQAQNADQGDTQAFNSPFELGGQIGNILPNQVPSVTEIHPQWGLRTGFGFGGSGTSEFGLTAGKGNGVDWKQLSASLRLDMPIEELVGIVYIGLDMTMYETTSKAQTILGGGHVGGGVMSLISKDLWFRADMKFNVNPGTSLFIGGGFLFRFGSSGEKE
jgi:hypothetical protein